MDRYFSDFAHVRWECRETKLPETPPHVVREFQDDFLSIAGQYGISLEGRQRILGLMHVSCLAHVIADDVSETDWIPSTLNVPVINLREGELAVASVKRLLSERYGVPEEDMFAAMGVTAGGIAGSYLSTFTSEYRDQGKLSANCIFPVFLGPDSSNSPR